MSSDVEILNASGDQTGAEDSARLSAAISRLTLDPSARRHSTILLTGQDYYFNQTISLGDVRALTNYATYGTVKSLNLHALTHARLNYVGSPTTGYFITVTGVTYSPTVRLKGLYLNCDWKCRGIIVHRQTYMAGIEDIEIYKPIEVGLDWVSAYGCRAENIYIWYPDGIGMRVWRSQGSSFDHVRIADGRDDNWPAIDDSTVLDHSNGAVFTQAAKRAAVFLHGRSITFKDLMFENNGYGSLPLCYINASGAHGVRFDGTTYFEANVASSCYFLIAGSTSTSSIEGHHFFWDMVDKADNSTVAALIKTTGYVDKVKVEDIYASSSLGSGMTNIIVCDGSGGAAHLYRAKVASSRLGIAAANQIVGVSGGVIETTSPYSINYTQVEQI